MTATTTATETVDTNAVEATAESDVELAYLAEGGPGFSVGPGADSAAAQMAGSPFQRGDPAFCQC